ncbi:MAG TPA: hypothetical protein VM529_09595 [Gemmata sp.]|nr:hypothetical protein [Gemmata sp.]
MNPRDDADDPNPVVRSLRAELLRLEAQLDQILAAEREHGDEVAALRLQMLDLRAGMDAVRDRYRRRTRVWSAAALAYGVAIGLWLGWLARLW